jgi:hypothetical protein
MADEERSVVLDLLEKNRDKQFVRRILEPEAYPKLDVGDGKVATHQMAWGEADGKFYVYPTVVYDEKDKKLRKLEDDKAFRHAMSTGEFITFDRADDAAWFSEKYKRAWE